jgi:general nucleoside transport system permease protein
MRQIASQILSLIAAAVAAAVVLAAVVSATGYDATDALTALWRGAFGSPDAILSATLVRATPLILTGLAVAVAFRAGIWNIGAEGQLLAGATAAAALGLVLPTETPQVLALPAVIIVGALAGAVWAGIAAWLKRQFNVLEVISTIMLNFLAAYGVAYLVRGPLQEPSHIYPQTASLPPGAHLPLLVPHSRLHAGLAIALIAALVAWWVLGYTAPGFRLRAAGANPFAAASAGLIDVRKTTTAAFLASGALAGLAGAVEVTGVTYALYENISPGFGYTAIAVALLASLDPLGVIGVGILFGALEAGGSAMQRDAGVPSVIVSVVEAALILIFLIPRWRGRTWRGRTWRGRDGPTIAAV